ncbi:MAG: DUF4375 domain-containing protein [bacterium]|nr:DUF4375 domain-containing protein [bacterium]MDD5756843.1 DUF4375 domain-containing protein [bacterium]
MRRSLNRSEYSLSPHLAWNAFIDLLAMSDYSQLTPIQQVAYLVFWYESEVQNGGHGQYFENRGIGMLQETLSALEQLGGYSQRNVLSEAFGIFKQNAVEFNEDPFDKAFHECSPNIQVLLEQYLKKWFEEFIELK